MEIFDKERLMQNMSTANILSELVYKDERVWKFMYLLVDLLEGRSKTDEELFVELKISKSKRVFESVILKNIETSITEEWKMKITSKKIYDLRETQLVCQIPKN